jgi:hypothetical protein
MRSLESRLTKFLKYFQGKVKMENLSVASSHSNGKIFVKLGIFSRLGGAMYDDDIIAKSVLLFKNCSASFGFIKPVRNTLRCSSSLTFL